MAPLIEIVAGVHFDDLDNRMYLNPPKLKFPEDEQEFRKAHEQDLELYRWATLGSTVVVGRTTWDSLPPRAKAGRNYLVLSTLAKGSNFFSSVPELMEASERRGIEKLIIAGGAKVYEQFAEVADLVKLGIYLYPGYTSVIATAEAQGVEEFSVATRGTYSTPVGPKFKSLVLSVTDLRLTYKMFGFGSARPCFTYKSFAERVKR